MKKKVLVSFIAFIILVYGVLPVSQNEAVKGLLDVLNVESGEVYASNHQSAAGWSLASYPNYTTWRHGWNQTIEEEKWLIAGKRGATYGSTLHIPTHLDGKPVRHIMATSVFDLQADGITTVRFPAHDYSILMAHSQGFHHATEFIFDNPNFSYANTNGFRPSTLLHVSGSGTAKSNAFNTVWTDRKSVV